MFSHEKMKETREHRGYTQVELARLAGCSRQTIINMELGAVRSPGVNLLGSIARALGVEIADLIEF